ncbi:MAG TPA: inorganic phosphate transporter [Polyangiaceae bacterium]|jgi:PiT family inorganic phosphate transporter
MHIFDSSIGTGQFILLLVALFIACAFEFVNGFHDTANAVATVIYTRSLTPWKAVILSGTLNLLGVYLGGIAVAMSIIKLLPAELLQASGSGAGLAMVLALLVAAIMWNLGTWWLGLPASSSHTLIGAIVGVGLANSLMPGHVFGSGINWHKVQEIGLSLLVSPFFGLGAAAGLLLLARKLLFRHPAIHQPADPNKTPPGWIRAILISTCSGVSFAHGSNDGQKGVGLIMLILIGLLPADFALNTALGKGQIHDTVAITDRLETNVREAFGGETGRMASTTDMAAPNTPAASVMNDLGEIRAALNGKDSIHDIPADARFDVRARIMRVDHQLADMEKASALTMPADKLAAIKKDRSTLRSSIDYAPAWVIGLIAISLGIGTMIGWKRIVVTVGEKIGKTHLTYAQGASAEIVAMTTIGLSGSFGLPVSTTHVLSSGIAGTMVAQKSGLQGSTVRNIALAWVLTLPAAMILGGGLFLLFRAMIPDAQAATTIPTVHFDATGDRAAVVPLSTQPLRVIGSNTIGAELAPSLAAGLLEKLGGKDVTKTKNAGGHAWVVTAQVPGGAKPLEIDIDAAGSTTGFDALAKGECDLGMASRLVTADEADRIQKAGFGDVRAPASENVIGLDGVAVIVNPGNALRTISTDDLARMFDGETVAWPASSGITGPIDVYARDDKSGTYDTFKSLVLGGHALPPNAKRFADSDELSAAVAADPKGIGFVSMSHMGRAAPVAVAENGTAGVVPSRFTVGAEDYPLTRRLYLYAPTPQAHPLTAQFISYALSPEGQTRVAAAGLVNLAAVAEDAQPCDGCSPEFMALTHGAKRLSLTFRFRAGQTDLDSRGQRDVGRLAALLNSQRNAHAMLLGFSDNQGTSDVNAQISQDRAKRVADSLEAYGLQPVTVQGLGSQMPVAANDTEMDRERNRRVEVWLKP